MPENCTAASWFCPALNCIFSEDLSDGPLEFFYLILFVPAFTADLSGFCCCCYFCHCCGQCPL